ncbi:transcriptional regulator FtrA [Bradyrhizobium sp. CER78]|uniref:transcriptional regulator FtrA n=1 Tax=Bradyrhizobium sp. CER78 TaxID=3039162 RepID=UPI002447705D|nr:transcriptional regulator FtrA [Bradyrhizobium sp. CER78]MDH2384321.1 transcriptional regulator FtrA [Bradyrhizobium sp. CER78]
MPYSVKIMPFRTRAAPKPTPSRRDQLVAVLAYDGVNAFELGMAVEVFGLTDMGAGWYRVVVCTEHPGRPLVANNGIRIVADASLKTLGRATTIIVPGWENIEDAPSAALLDALRRAHRRGARIASICAGVFVLAAAGLLDGRRATGHWAQVDLLSSKYPTIEVDPNVLYVDDGDIMSSAGRAAGLDLCLHIVRRDYGAQIANQVAQRLVVPPHREGGQAQYIPQPVRKAEGDALASVFAWAQRHLDQDLAINSLASRARMSRRTFIRRFEEATGMTPGEWVVQARVSRARELLEATQLPIEGIATATGFGSVEALRHHFRQRLGTSPVRYRAVFQASARSQAGADSR